MLCYILWFFGILSMGYGVFVLIDNLFYKGTVYDVSISITSVYVSVGLALIAIGISFWADIKMNIDSNESFLKIVDDFEDKRIELFWLCKDGNYKTLFRDIWKFERYTERVVRLYEIKNIQKENVDLFFDQIEKLLFWTMIPWRGRLNKRLRREDISHMMKICELVGEFKLNDNQKIKLAEFVDYVEYMFNYCIN